MTFDEILSRLIDDTVRHSLGLFAPELALCVTVVGLLLVRLVDADRWLPTSVVALVGAFVAFGLAYYQFLQLDQVAGPAREELFTGLLVYDKFTVFFRLFLLLFLMLTVALTMLSGIPDNEDGPDFYTLLLGSVIGMMLMASSNHLLILFLSVEMASVPSYAMVGFQKGRRLSSEAALKVIVYGAGAAGVMLYGISLLAGLLGTASFPELAVGLRDLIGQDGGVTDPAVRTAVLAVMLVLVGLAFKLSVVPFHFWCPDAFHGASAEVAGFLSVASKAAAFALLARFALALIAPGSEALAQINLALGIGIGVIAAITATFGNLAAYAQTNMKRMLAYSTIAHAGYMLMAVSAMMVVLNGGLDPEFARTEGQRALAGLLYYLSVYLFMNLGAFAIVALIRNQIYSEEIEDYSGLFEQAPFLCAGMAVCLFSLVGMPPLGGFFGKWYIFAALYQAGTAHPAMWALLVIGGLNTVFSLFYYVHVLKVMFIAPRPDEARPVALPVNSFAGAYVLLFIALPILALGMAGPWMAGLTARAQEAAAVLIQ